MGSLCTKSPQGAQAGSVLDRVISQSSSEDDCLLYKLANYLGGGELIDAYNIGGQQEVEKLIAEQFAIFLYNNGKGKTITKTDYFKWFCRGSTNKSSRSANRSGSTSSPSGGFLDPESGYLLGPESAGKSKHGPESPMGYDGRHSSNNGLASNKNSGLRMSVRGGSIDGSRRGSLWANGGENGYDYQGGWGQKAPIRSAHDPLVHWKDHPACWRMEYRGALGESLLHVLVMCDTKFHTKLATILVTIFPRLALDVVEGEEYLGASALHLAIAYHNSDLATLLVECGATINQRAIGSFFLPYDQQGTQPKPETNYSGLAYLGEYPLAWAATCGNESVYNFLLDKGADPDLQDSLGNMVLHVLVINDKLDMYGYALRHPKKPARNEILNDAGLTPLTLACKLGRNLIFQEMLELSCIEFWRYSNITCSGYPLLALDTILPSGKTNWNSALMIILNGDSTEHLDMLEGGVIQRLLEEKWKTFARIQFLKRLAILFVHLLTLSGAVALRVGEYAEDNLRISKQRAMSKMNRMPAGMATTTTTPVPTPEKVDNDFDEIEEGVEVVKNVFEIGTLIGCLSYMIIQLGGEIANQGLYGFLRSLMHTPPKAIFLLSNFMILGCVPFRAIKIYYEGDCDWCTKWEDSVLAVAVPSSWFFLMFFAGAVRLTGPFVTMIFNMITGDMVTFSIIYGVILLGFSQTFYFLYMGHDDRGSTAFASYASTWMGLFHMTLGEYDMDHDRTSYPVLTTLVFCVFMVMVPILLLNMLIAMMGNTYAMVIDRSEKEFVKQWANIVINLERAVNQKDAKEHLMSYSIKIAGNAEDGTEQRAVMVIKSKSKTKAKQRKGALSNWKRVGKCTITELRRRQCTGEQLRNEIFNREGPLPPVPRRRRGAAAVAAAQQQQPGGEPAAPAAAGPPGKPGDPAKPVDPFGKIAGIGHGLEPDEEEEEDELQPGEESRFSNALSQLAFNADLDIPDGTANYGYPSVLDENVNSQAGGQQPPSLPLTGTAGAPSPMQLPNAPKPPVEEPCRKIYAPGQLATPVAAIEAASLDGVPPQPILVSPNVQTICEDDRKKKPAPKKKRKLHPPLKDKLWKPTKPAPRQSIFGFQITQDFHSSMDAMMEFDNLGFSDSEDETDEEDDQRGGAVGGGGGGGSGGEVTMVTRSAPPPCYAAACGMVPDMRVTSSGPKKIEVGAAPQQAPDKYGKRRPSDSKMGPGITLNPRALHQHQQQRIQAAIDEQERKKKQTASKDDIGVQAETAEKQQGRTERQQQKKERPWTAAQHRRQELEEQNSSSNVQSLTSVLAWEQDDGF